MPYTITTMPYRVVENSKNTGGESGNNPAGGSGQLTVAQIDELNALAQGMGCTHFANHVQMDTDAQMRQYYTQYNANYNLRTLEEEARAWADSAHSHGMKVLWRGGWSGVKGNNNFPFVTYGTGNFIPLGTVAGAPTEGETTYCGKFWRFLSQNLGPDHIEDGDIFAPISECTEFLSNANYRWFNNSSGDQAGLQTFFLTMHDVLDAYAATIGKTLKYLTIVNYSEYRSGYLGNTLPNDTGFIAIDYYGHHGTNPNTGSGWGNGNHVEPSDYVADWVAVKSQVGGTASLFQTEMGGIWGDSWPTLGANPGQGRKVTITEDQLHYQIQFWKAYRDSIIAPGHMFGVSNWGFWSGQNSSIVRYTGGHYYLNSYGQIYSNFIKGGGMARIPVPNSLTSDSFGNRSNYF